MAQKTATATEIGRGLRMWKMTAMTVVLGVKTTVAGAVTGHLTMNVVRGSQSIETTQKTGTDAIVVIGAGSDAIAAVKDATRTATTDDAATALTARTIRNQDQKNPPHRTATALLDERAKFQRPSSVQAVHRLRDVICSLFFQSDSTTRRTMCYESHAKGFQL
jgi:hypothetical protein